MPAEGELFSVTITVPGQPRGWGRAMPIVIGGHARMVTDNKTRSEKGAVRMIAAAAMNGRPPYAGPVVLRLCAYRAVLSSLSKARRALALSGELAPSTRPDFDNYAKLAADALNGLVWVDDAQIVTAVIHKRYSEAPRLVIDVRSFSGTEA